jgi:hypothetical protein
MKKKIIALVGIITLSSSALFSQIEQGTFMIGGNAYFNYSFPSGVKASSDLNISPNAGFFIVDNMAIGASMMFNSFKGGSSFSVAPFMRAYYKENFYGQLQVGFGRSSFEVAGTTTTTSGLNTELDLGYTIFLTDNIALDPALYYNFYTNGSEYGGSNLGMKIGFQLFLNR